MSVQAGQRVGRRWRGLIEEYRDRLPVTAATPVVTLGEGGTPLVYAPTISQLTGCEVHLKVEGDRKSTRLNSSHLRTSRMPSSA